MPSRRIGSYTNLAPQQEISINPFDSFNSDTVNKLTRAVTYGRDGVVNGLDLRTIRHNIETVYHSDFFNTQNSDLIYKKADWEFDNEKCTPFFHAGGILLDGFRITDITEICVQKINFKLDPSKIPSICFGSRTICKFKFEFNLYSGSPYQVIASVNDDKYTIKYPRHNSNKVSLTVVSNILNFDPTKKINMMLSFILNPEDYNAGVDKEIQQQYYVGQSTLSINNLKYSVDVLSVEEKQEYYDNCECCICGNYPITNIHPSNTLYITQGTAIKDDVLIQENGLSKDYAVPALSLNVYDKRSWFKSNPFQPEEFYKENAEQYGYVLNKQNNVKLTGSLNTNTNKLEFFLSDGVKIGCIDDYQANDLDMPIDFSYGISKDQILFSIPETTLTGDYSYLYGNTLNFISKQTGAVVKTVNVSYDFENKKYPAQSFVVNKHDLKCCFDINKIKDYLDLKISAGPIKVSGNIDEINPDMVKWANVAIYYTYFKHPDPNKSYIGFIRDEDLNNEIYREDYLVLGRVRFISPTEIDLISYENRQFIAHRCNRAREIEYGFGIPEEIRVLWIDPITQLGDVPNNVNDAINKLVRWLHIAMTEKQSQYLYDVVFNKRELLKDNRIVSWKHDDPDNPDTGHLFSTDVEFGFESVNEGDFITIHNDGDHYTFKNIKGDFQKKITGDPGTVVYNTGVPGEVVSHTILEKVPLVCKQQNDEYIIRKHMDEIGDRLVLSLHRNVTSKVQGGNLVVVDNDPMSHLEKGRFYHNELTGETFWIDPNKEVSDIVTVSSRDGRPCFLDQNKVNETGKLALWNYDDNAVEISSWSIDELLGYVKCINAPKIGNLKLFAVPQIPEIDVMSEDFDGWVYPDGRAISRTEFKCAFDVFGTHYGPGDGSTTFNIPDLRDFIRLNPGLIKGLNPLATVWHDYHNHVKAHIHEGEAKFESKTGGSLTAKGWFYGTQNTNGTIPTSSTIPESNEAAVVCFRGGHHGEVYAKKTGTTTDGKTDVIVASGKIAAAKTSKGTYFYSDDTYNYYHFSEENDSYLRKTDVQIIIGGEGSTELTGKVVIHPNDETEHIPDPIVELEPAEETRPRHNHIPVLIYIGRRFGDKFNVKFLDFDGTLLADRYVRRYQAAEPPEHIPEREGYVFRKWDPDTYYSVKHDMVVYARYDLSSYTVKFINSVTNIQFDIQYIKTDNKSHAITPSVIPENPGYTFTGFSENWTPETIIVSNLNVYALYNRNSYTVRFLDWDNTLLKTQTVLGTDDANPPTNPSRQHYRFTGWDNDYRNVVQNIDCKAVYEQIKHTVTFHYMDKNAVWVTTTQTVVDGESATYPTIVTVEGYEFTGWNSDVTNVTRDMDVYALYNEIVKQVSVKFVDWDGTLIKEFSVAQHTSIVDDPRIPSNPTRDGYLFKEWVSDNGSTFDEIEEDTIFTATYTSLLVNIVFDPNGGTVNPESKIATYGQPYGELPIPTKSGCDFINWKKINGTVVTEEDIVDELGQIVLKADWHNNDVTITFHDNVIKVTYNDNIS